MYPVSNAIINMVIKMKSYKDIVWLFSINVFISTFTFGGGYVVIPMIRKYYVEKKVLILKIEENFLQNMQTCIMKD